MLRSLPLVSTNSEWLQYRLEWPPSQKHTLRCGGLTADVGGLLSVGGQPRFRRLDRDFGVYRYLVNLGKVLGYEHSRDRGLSSCSATFGSSSFTKLEDGNYQCDYCRTKYTPAQALLVEGVVRVDRSDEIGRLLVIAINAYEAGDHDESYEYANRILEIDHEHARAWFLKGASAGWGSNLSNCQAKLREMEQCFITGSQKLQSADREVFLSECSNVGQSVVEAVCSISLRHTCDFSTEFANRRCSERDRSG